MDGSAAGIPQWIMWVGAAIGSFMGAFVIRMGWKSAGGEKDSSSGTFVLDAALVDSASIKQLTAAIEGYTLEAITARSENSRAEIDKTHSDEKGRQALYRLVEVLTSMSKQLDSLDDSVRDMTKEIVRGGK